MANPPKPWKADYAKSSRSSCKTCKSLIENEILRLGKMVHSTLLDGFMPIWNHASCVLREANQIKSVDDVEGIELLRWEDQQKIRKYVDSADSAAVASNTFGSAVVECGVEVSKTSRANCHICNQKIMKGEIRISAKPKGQGPRSLIWNHAKCYLETSSAFQPEKLPGWDSLSDSDRATLLSLVKKNTSTSKGTKAEPEEQSTSKGNAKRKNAHECDQNSKIAIPGGDASSSKVKGQSAVHEQSELQDSGHILEDGNSIYNTTLNMSDLSTGVNSYYILQIIQDDKSSNCYVFWKWGRVGSEKIGGHNLDEMSKSDAIQEFKRLFLVKTGNAWEAWERKKDFQKKPGRFYPLDIDYGVKDPSMKKQLDFTSSKLAPQLVELMKMLFNVETYMF